MVTLEHLRIQTGYKFENTWRKNITIFYKDWICKNKTA